jgi:flagellar assembly protein FliH
MSKPGSFRNIPPPPGSKAGTGYSRFIPREELGEVASWNPGAVGERRQTPRTAHPATQTAADAVAPAAEPSAEEWRARIATARQQGYQDGYRDGTAALESFKQSFASQATAQIGGLLDGFDAQFAALDQRLAKTVTRVAVQLAQQVLRAELQQHPAVVAQVATEAVNAVMLSARHISVHVHPADLPLVAEGAEEALQARGGRLLADASVERGGVRVVSDVGSVDASLATRWAQASAAIGADVPWPGAPLNGAAARRSNVAGSDGTTRADAEDSARSGPATTTESTL